MEEIMKIGIIVLVVCANLVILFFAWKAAKILEEARLRQFKKMCNEKAMLDALEKDRALVIDTGTKPPNPYLERMLNETIDKRQSIQNVMLRKLLVDKELEIQNLKTEVEKIKMLEAVIELQKTPPKDLTDKIQQLEEENEVLKTQIFGLEKYPKIKEIDPNKNYILFFDLDETCTKRPKPDKPKIR